MSEKPYSIEVSTSYYKRDRVAQYKISVPLATTAH